MECPRELLSTNATPGARLVLVDLWTYAAPSRLHVWPSVPTIAKDTRQADRSVRRHLDELEREGLITRTAHRRGGVVVWVLTEVTVVATGVPPQQSGPPWPPLTKTPPPLTKPAAPRTDVASPSEQTREQTKSTPTSDAGARVLAHSWRADWEIYRWPEIVRRLGVTLPCPTRGGPKQEAVQAALDDFGRAVVEAVIAHEARAAAEHVRSQGERGRPPALFSRMFVGDGFGARLEDWRGETGGDVKPVGERRRSLVEQAAELEEGQP